MESGNSKAPSFEVKKYLLKKNLKRDLPSSIVVFLVALPLCLGIALASGAPLFAGLIAGIVGGIVVGLASGSQLSVSGPAAGLTVIVLGAITSLGNYKSFYLLWFWRVFFNWCSALLRPALLGIIFHLV